MIFRAAMLAKVLDGSKTVTRRPAGLLFPSREYGVGRVYAIQPGRGQHAIAHLRVTSRTLRALGTLDDEDAQLEGFPNAAAFFAYWRSLYGDVDLKQLVNRIEFELAPTPVTIQTVAEIENLRKPYRARSWTLICERAAARLGITHDQVWDALALSDPGATPPPRPDP